MTQFAEIAPNEIMAHASERILEGGRRDFDFTFRDYRHLTNFRGRLLDAYDAAIEEYKQNGGAGDFLFSEIAPYFEDNAMRNNDSCYSLWGKDVSDAKAFWAILREKIALQEAIWRITNQKEN